MSTRCVTVPNVLFQVSQVYQTIEFSRLAALAPFASQFHIERIVVNAAKNLDLQVRIDHRNRMLSFGTDLGVAQKEDCPEVRKDSGKYVEWDYLVHVITFSAWIEHKFNAEIITRNRIEKHRWKFFICYSEL